MTNAKIMIVEDERIVALDIQKSLKKMGYDVLGIVSSGEAAIEKADVERPDLVLMDILLEGVPGGIMAAGQIRARFNIPVIYLTAHSDDEPVQNAIATEPLGHILKPFKDRELNIVIESALYKHRMDTQLKQTQRWFAAVLKSIGDAVIVTDKNGCISFINDSAEKLTGWRKEETLGEKMPDVMTLREEGLQLPIFSGMEKVIREGMVINLIKDQMLVVKDGKTVPVSDSLAPTRDEAGEISGTVMIFRDVSKSLQAEEMLRESEDRYRDLVTHSHDLICTHDLEGRVLSINPAAEAAMGLPVETLLKMNIKDGLSPGYVDAFSEYLETLRQKGIAEGVMRVQAPGGQIQFWEYRNTLRKEGVKAPIVRGMARDITEQKRAEKERYRHNRMVEAVNRVQLRYISTQEISGVMKEILQDALALTKSEYGFLGEVLYSGDGAPYLKTHALTDISWNEATQALYRDNAEKGLEFHNLGSLFGAAMKTGGPVLSKDPENDSRRGGLPAGHPPLTSFAGLPLYHGDEMVGLLGIANCAAGYDEHCVNYLAPLLTAGANFIQAARIDQRRLQAEEEMKSIKQDWEDIFNAIGDLVLILDPDYTILKANRSVFSHTRHSPEELAGRKCHEIFHGSDAPPSSCPMKELLNTKNQRIAPMLVEALETTFLTSCTPVFDEAGDIRQIIHIATDITSVQQTQEALRASETLFREMFENSPVGMAIILPDGRIDMTNPAFGRMLDMDAETLKQKSFRDITYPDDLAVSNEFVQEATAGEKHSDQFEKRYIRSDGEIVWALVSTVLIRDPKGDPHYFISHIVDISLQKKALEVRQQLESQLRQAQKMDSIGTLAGGIAHDFNNILSSIIGYAELSEDYAEKGTALHQYLKAVLAAGDRAKDLVRQILTFARQSDVEEKPVQAKYLVNESLKLLRASIPSTIVFRRNIQSDSSILTNPTQIHQVVMNLCTNAAQAMEEKGGTLEVDLKDVVFDENAPNSLLSGKYLLLSVRDTGPGIGPDIMEKIFDPYFTTKPKGEGTGLGLSVVKGIVNSCSGFIEVNSRIGQGTEFDIYFPVFGPEAKEKTEAIKKHNIPTGNERILFVDDEPTIAELTGKILTTLGYQVVVRTGSIEAFELFKADPKAFDLVISDITMPNMAGNVLAAEVLKIRPDIPIILCTGYSKRISEERAKEIGVKAFLYKPIVKSQLAEAIRKVLDDAKYPLSGFGDSSHG